MDRKFLLDNDVSFRRYSDIYRRDPQGIHGYRGYSAIVLLIFCYFGGLSARGGDYLPLSGQSGNDKLFL